MSHGLTSAQSLNLYIGQGRKIMRIKIALAVAFLTATGLVAAAESDAAIKRYELNIPRQALDSALKDLAQQTKLQVGRFSDAVKGNELVGPLAGQYSATQALDHLLESSGLTYRSLNERAIIVLRPEDVTQLPASSATEIRGMEDDAGRMSDWKGVKRLAQAGDFSQAQDSASSPAENQTMGSEEQGDKLEEIVVSAQKRDERLQDVPISISVLSGETLDKAKFTSVADALSTIPGVGLLQGAQSGGNAIAIRGVASGGSMFFGGATAAYYLDSVPFGLVNEAFAPDSNPYDLERVEVLRGPQGTLHGAAALNGVIRVLTKAPDLDEFSLKAQTTLSSTEHGDPSYRVDTAVNVPLVEGKLAARVVAGYDDRGGWVDKPNVQQKDVNSGTQQNVRAKIKAQPTDNLSIDLSAWHSRDEYDGFAGADRGWTNPATANESLLVDYEVYGLTVDYTLPLFTVSSMTGYMDLENISIFDFSWALPQIPVIGTLNNSDVFSEELVLNSSSGGPWRWTVGAMYRDSTEQLWQTFDGTTPSADGVADVASESLAVFGELTRIFGQLELTAGLRHFKDSVTVDQPAIAFHSENRVHATSPRVVLTWHPTDDAMLYGSYAEGFRSGGTRGTDEIPTLKPDTLKNYEIGAKGGFLDGRLQYDVSVFYMDWQDIQQTRTITLPSGIPVSARINGDSASGIGTDVGLTLQPIKGLTLGLNFSWNDLTLDKDVPSVVGGANVVFANAGDRIPFSPEYTAGLSADYAFPLGASGFEAVFSASASYVSSQIFRTILFDQILSETGDNTTIGRVGFSIHSPRHWQVNLFVNNINNEQGVVAPDLFSYVPVRARPRTVGVQFAYNYGR